MSIPIGKKGYIVTPDVPEPYIFVEDDLNNTGGFLIYLSDSPDFITGHDRWVLEEDLDEFFKEVKWQVKWTEN